MVGEKKLGQAAQFPAPAKFDQDFQFDHSRKKEL